MFKIKSTFSSFSIKNIEKTLEFYTMVLKLQAEDNGMGITISLPGGNTIFAYVKENHQPATFTVLHLVVDNIDKAVEELSKRGVVFDEYEGFHQDEKRIARGLSINQGPDIAWFTDPSGNILAVLQDKK